MAATAAARPQVTVFSSENGQAHSTVALPPVFKAPIRLDVVQFVHTQMAKNKRQPYAVKNGAGMRHAAESWGTGRAVSRIPRVTGSGTNRSGQGAFGNMCRKGRMFNPTRVWRHWHRKINKNQKRYAVVSALAASALPALVEARGHRITNLPQVPLVVDNGLESVTKTKAAVKLLQALGAYADIEHSKDSRKVRAGKGKMRNRRFVQRRGPLVVYNKDDGVVRGFRNLPGVELCPVSALNLLQLAPGGHVGRFIIYSQDAFTKLEAIFGSETQPSDPKYKRRGTDGYRLPRSVVFNADLGRIINSDEIQSVVRPMKRRQPRAHVKKNPLKNLTALVRLNPYAKSFKRNEFLFAEQRRKENEAKKKARADKAGAKRQ